MRVTPEKLHDLIKTKFMKAGLSEDHANTTTDILVWSDLKGIHSHGAVRVEYYSERIVKGGINTKPDIKIEQVAPSLVMIDGDNGVGFEIAKQGMEKGIEVAKKNGICVVGMKRMSHSGAIGYYTEMAAKEDCLALSWCQSDPMVVPYGGTEPYYGTNPISFSAPADDGRILLFDMATTVQAWGKILDAKSKGKDIPEGWAVDEQGQSVTNPNEVNALLPIAGPKGYGLMMMVDILSGMLLGVPFGSGVSSMYHDLSQGRELGQMHIIFDPSFFVGTEAFKKSMSMSLDELTNQSPAPGFDKVSYPGEGGESRKQEYLEKGIEIVDEIYYYLESDDIHFDRYDHKNRFAE